MTVTKGVKAALQRIGGAKMVQYSPSILRRRRGFEHAAGVTAIRGDPPSVVRWARRWRGIHRCTD